MSPGHADVLSTSIDEEEGVAGAYLEGRTMEGDSVGDGAQDRSGWGNDSTQYAYIFTHRHCRTIRPATGSVWQAGGSPLEASITRRPSRAGLGSEQWVRLSKRG